MRRYLPFLIVTLVRTLSATLRFRVEDRCGITTPGKLPAVIWAFWHNRILAVPMAREKFTPDRRGSVLTSPSKDGAILAGVMERFGIDAVRGSSSRRGAIAMKELIGVLGRGGDIAITPDGPRGPVYQLAPGIVKLAQVTGTPVMPIQVHFSRYWELKSWDRFRIPKPFSVVTVIFDTLETIPETLEGDDAAFEAERVRLEARLLKSP